MLITQALAGSGDAAAPVAEGRSYFEPLLLLAFVALFYFLIWRPQSKRTKAHRELVGGLVKGDEVVSSAGIMGRVTKVGDDFIRLKVSTNVEINLQRSAVSATLPKGTLKAFEEA